MASSRTGTLQIRPGEVWVVNIPYLGTIDTAYLVRKIGSLDAKTLATLRKEARKLIG